jgi:FKBP-type peptidyl-prolyl cis-trans isomerase
MKAHSWRAAAFAAALGLAAGCTAEAVGEKKVTASGTSYVDLKEGDGPAAQFNDILLFTSTGRLADGQEFEKHDRTNPAHLRLGFRQPVVGLDEAMEGMKVGGKRKIWVPARAGFGPKGVPKKVPPNSDLVFEVELIKISSAEQIKADVEKERAKKQEEADKVQKAAAAELNKPVSGKDIPKGEQKEVTTASGLKYVDERVGDGREATPGNYVTVLYVGKLANGKQFDANLRRNRPFNFALGQGKVIKGWDEGLVGMRAGGKRRLIVPPELGYGDQAIKGPTGEDSIPANSTLIFDVELLRVQ